jgi:hypothetical protein
VKEASETVAVRIYLAEFGLIRQNRTTPPKTISSTGNAALFAWDAKISRNYKHYFENLARQAEGHIMAWSRKELGENFKETLSTAQALSGKCLG